MASKPVSQKQYLKDEHCPMCGGSEVEGGPINVEGGNAFQDISCMYESCGADWTDEYKLVRYDNLTDREGNTIEAPPVYGTGPTGACVG